MRRNRGLRWLSIIAAVTIISCRSGEATTGPTGAASAARTSGAINSATSATPGTSQSDARPTGPPPATPSATYPPDPQHWTPVADMAQPRIGHAAALLPDGRVLVTGGNEIVAVGQGGVDGISLNSVEIFDPTSGSWSAGPSMHDARGDHMAVSLVDGRVFVIGGTFDPEDSSVGSAVTTAEIYDPASNAWTDVDNIPDREAWTSATLLKDGRLFLIGSTTRAYPREMQASIFDPAADEWSDVAETDLVRGGHRTLVLTDGSVLVAGGFDPTAEEAGPQDDAAVYYPKKNVWSNVGPMESGAYDMRMTLLPDGRALGFWTPNQLFDPIKRTWAAAGDPPIAGIEEVVELLDGRILVFPSNDGSGSAGNLAVFDPRTDAWAAFGRFIQVTGMSVTRLEDGRVLSAGGYLGCYGSNPCATGDIATAWVFDPAGAS